MLALVGVEFIFFIVASTELHFGFVLEAVLITHSCVYENTLRDDFLTAEQSLQSVKGGAQGEDAARTGDPS